MLYGHWHRRGIDSLANPVISSLSRIFQKGFSVSAGIRRVVPAFLESIHSLKVSFLSTVALIVTVLAAPTASQAQNRLHDRIVRKPEAESRFVVKGNVHPFAKARYDQGRIDPSFQMERITMMFKPTDAQQSELDTLVEDQQNPASANYHKWLTPEEFAGRFGLSSNDVDQIVSWLQAQGFTVNEVARTRRWVTFSGQARQVESAFQTTMHLYAIEGGTFYANATDPVIPAAFGEVVSGFRSLNNFRLNPRPRLRHVDGTASPQFTSSVTGNHYLAPADFATIYDLGSLYAAGFDGTGQKIAIMGQTNIQVSDIHAFRSASGLPVNDPQIVIVPGSSDPGIVNGDVEEAALDLEWSGAVGRNAQIIFVTSKNGVFDSLQYTINQNLAPVISISYGACEPNFTPQEAASIAALAQQANAQGMTIVASSGDSGAADCESTSTKIASQGLAVDMPASLPYVTAVGGSEFREVTTSWNTTSASNNGSALSYIPEVVWNDTAAVGTLSAGGGGRSIYFPKPSWQTGTGVPSDNARDVPDISLNASGGHDGYLICSQGSCANGFRSSNGGLLVVGGTSAGAPAFAGVVAIINQLSNSIQGNVNPKLYASAASSPSAFHDITSGGNKVPCQAGTPNCPSGGSIGYSAGVGYDQASGLGSVDIASLLSAWVPGTGASTSPAPSDPASTTTISATSTPTPISTPVATAPQPISSLPPSATMPQPITDVEQGTVRSGYAVVTPAANSPAPTPTVTFGTVKGGLVQSQAGVFPMPVMTDASLFVDVVPGIGRDLGVAIVNPSPAPNSITLTLRDQSGTVTGAPATILLQSQQQLAKFVTELLPPTTTGSAFRGSLELQSSTPFAVLGLRFSGGDFSTLPVTGTVANAVGGTAVVLPQFAMAGGWATQIALVNKSTSAAQGRIDIFDSAGNPMAVTLNGATQSTFLYSIPTGGVFMLAPQDVNGQSPF
jgi:hypothetical protein